MRSGNSSRRTALRGILIAPDAELGARFSEGIGELSTFELLLELKSYPSGQTLSLRIKQLQPDVVIVDAGTSLAEALRVIAHTAQTSPQVSVVAIDRRSNSDTIVRTLRAGASEFLYAPFDPASVSEAVSRLLQLCTGEPDAEVRLGSVCVFSSVKPGSGASTLAAQTAFALQRRTSDRVLLADFDFLGGTIGFYLKLDHGFSALDALQRACGLNHSVWTSLVASHAGLDVMPAPLLPRDEDLDTNGVVALLDYARTLYDWIVIDLPVVFQRTSLITIPQADRTFLVSSSELPSLHLARKSITMLEQLGFPKERFQMVVNRVSRRDGMSRQDIEKLFQCPVHASFPNDYFSLHRVITNGDPLGPEDDLGRAVDNFAAQISGAAAADSAKTRSVNA